MNFESIFKYLERLLREETRLVGHVQAKITVLIDAGAWSIDLEDPSSQNRVHSGKKEGYDTYIIFSKATLTDISSGFLTFEGANNIS